MTYAELLAEFVRVTGHKPGEMNKRSSVCSCGVGRAFLDNAGPCSCDCGNPACYLCVAKRNPMERISLEPPAQSAGPGRCNRYVKVARGFAAPCVLDDGHEGPHEL